MPRGTRPPATVLLALIASTLAGCEGDATPAPVESTTTITSVSTTSAAPAPSSSTTATPTTAASTTTSSPTTSAPNAPVPFSDEFELTGLAVTEDESTDPGGIVFHDGEWHMFLLAIPVWRQEANVRYATSADGITWDRHGELFDQEDLELPYAGLTIAISSAIVLDDGTWVLYFHTITSTATLSSGVIGRLTAPGPDGPWTADSQPVLEPGGAGAWDSWTIGHPSVLRVGDELWMFYDGFSGDSSDGNRRSVGLATSSDGVTWVKHDDPATSDGLYAASDPVLTPTEGAWDADAAYDANVVLTDDGFVMSYTSATTKSDQTCCSYRWGLAYSEDGTTWTKDPGSPFFSTDRLGFTWTGLSTLIHHEDRYILLANLETVLGEAFDVRIWRLVHDGPLGPSA